MKRVYKDFDLPTNHLPGERHYVPPKARSDEEIERRRAQPPGVLLAEYQQRGVAAASVILKHVQEPEDVAFTARILAASGINSAWYGYAQHSEVMRRRLKLPILATGDPPNVLEPGALLDGAGVNFTEATGIAGRLINAIKLDRPTIETYQMHLGRRIGNASLALACVSLEEGITANTEADIQALVRQQSLVALHDSRALEREIGTYPSVAQLADPDSDLSVFWRRTAPNGALQAYEIAAAS